VIQIAEHVLVHRAVCPDGKHRLVLLKPLVVMPVFESLRLMDFDQVRPTVAAAKAGQQRAHVSLFDALAQRWRFGLPFIGPA
jgi:hypothetical protein